MKIHLKSQPNVAKGSIMNSLWASYTVRGCVRLSSISPFVICRGHVRTARGFHQQCSLRTATAFNNTPTLRLQQAPTYMVRSLSTPTTAVNASVKAKKTKSEKNKSNQTADDNTPQLSYWDQKKAAKDRRRELYVARMERQERLAVRRAGRPKMEKKLEFQRFFIRKKVQDEVWDRRARQAGLDWKIRVAVLVERIPIVLDDKPEWEVEYDKMKAHLNLYGKLYPKELVGEMDWDAVRPMTDDELLAQLPFAPAPRETLADASGDVRTLQRRLKSKVYLTVQSEPNSPWQLPTVDISDHESLLEAAKRAVPKLVGDDLEFWCPSNAPWTVDLRAYSDAEKQAMEQQGQTYFGTKTFVMKVQYTLGDVDTATMAVHDFAWLDRHEVTERVRQQQGDHASQYYYYML
jgi:large subunit ribosomal protein L46